LLRTTANVDIQIPTNVNLLRKLLVAFIANEVEKVGLNRVVVGLSGGVDSSLSALLAAEALGPKNVMGIMMPYETSSPESLAHAELVVRQSAIEPLTIDITPQIDAYFKRFPDADQRRRGNKMARERMTILYDHSARWNALVLGTSNKTELLLGYGTLHGDMASAINPLGDLYKTQVWALAEAVGVPEPIVRKKPSADLWAGQTDEAELGFSYREVDRLLYLMVDERYAPADLEKAGFSEKMIEDVTNRIMSSQFKRRLPIIAKVSHRTIDRDFRYARDWGK
jgi:NAD+ synthase